VDLARRARVVARRLALPESEQISPSIIALSSRFSVDTGTASASPNSRLPDPSEACTRTTTLLERGAASFRTDSSSITSQRSTAHLTEVDNGHARAACVLGRPGHLGLQRHERDVAAALTKGRQVELEAREAMNRSSHKTPREGVRPGPCGSSRLPCGRPGARGFRPPAATAASGGPAAAWSAPLVGVRPPRRGTACRQHTATARSARPCASFPQARGVPTPGVRTHL
jgi:hypothetical protein